MNPFWTHYEPVLLHALHKAPGTFGGHNNGPALRNSWKHQRFKSGSTWPRWRGVMLSLEKCIDLFRSETTKVGGTGMQWVEFSGQRGIQNQRLLELRLLEKTSYWWLTGSGVAAWLVGPQTQGNLECVDRFIYPFTNGYWCINTFVHIRLKKHVGKYRQKFYWSYLALLWRY